ncbi:MAG: glycosyltransferase family 39 protein [Armatimonadota bacterium]|nr:glycosyltransferase family 39 protein [Armatimonadota bacterium]MDR7452322.1 glycosyltransferase family 39 protein [Armatimonadota bacterium]MDR7467787.1 glycosyltransferase family 39 protein [Armatimonadota bacterium]MDR7494627.1 glycosyltransferase family 39 protein [Armatimonadota bacterium]MDR7499687.1 glycosyltransferase family 39 protein [Armatimonadota bacterium]
MDILVRPPGHLAKKIAFRWKRVAVGRELLLALVIVTGACLRLSAIGRKTLWYDEAFSWWMAGRTAADIWRLSRLIDFHPPLYYGLLHLWTGWFGDHEAILRLPSAAISIAALPLVYALGRRLAGDTAALLATALIATSPFHLYFGQEARMYALFAFACLLAMWGAAAIDQAAGQPSGGGLRRRGWLAYVGGTALALWSHDAAVLFWAVAAVLLLSAGFGRQALRAGFLLRYALAQLAVLALWSPWMIPAIEQILTDRGTTTMAVGDALTALERLYFPLQGLPLPPRWEPPLVALILPALAGHVLWQTIRDPRWERVAVAVLWLVAPLLLFAVGPFVFHRALRWDGAARAVIWTSIPAAVAIARAVVAYPKKLATTAVIGLLTLNLAGAASYFRHPKARKETIARHIAQRAKRGDVVVFYLPSGVILFDYYYVRFGGPDVIRRGIPADFPGRPGELRRAEWLLGRQMTEEDIRRLEQYVRENPRVWFVYGWTQDEPFPAGRIDGLVRVDILPGAARVSLYEGDGEGDQGESSPWRKSKVSPRLPDAVPPGPAGGYPPGPSRMGHDRSLTTH